jgi:DNA-binding transcriptional LysR family regulator
MYFLPGLLKAFLSLHVQIDLRITSLMSAQVIRRVLDREIDLGIITLANVPLSLESIPLFRQQFVCIASREHPIAARKVVELQELSSEPMIVLDRQSVTRQQIDAFFQKIDCTLRPILELSNFEIMKKYVAAGLGIALVPEAAVASSREGICVVPLQAPIALQVGAVLRKDREPSLIARAFLSMAQEHFRAGTPRRSLTPEAS